MLTTIDIFHDGLGLCVSGTSSWTIAHAMQRAVAGKFQKFDYCTDSRNILEYGDIVPPCWNLDKISNHHMALVTSVDDAISTLQDATLLRQKFTGIDNRLLTIEILSYPFYHILVPLIDDYVIMDDGFSHVDFVIGQKSGPVVNDHVLALLEQYGK